MIGTHSEHASSSMPSAVPGLSGLHQHRWFSGVLRLRGGHKMGNDSNSGNEESGGEMGYSSNVDSVSAVDESTRGSGVTVPGDPRQVGDGAHVDDAGDATTKKRKRKQRRGPKNDPTGKRKHRGRRGGKYAKAARAKRAAIPMDEHFLGEIQSVATTLAEISAAAPHAAEKAAPSNDCDPALRFIAPSLFDGLDDIKRTTIYDERHELLGVGPEFSQRLSGSAPPLAWSQTWFPHAFKLGYKGTNSTTSASPPWPPRHTPALPAWANRSLEASSGVEEVRVSHGGQAFCDAISSASDTLALRANSHSSSASRLAGRQAPPFPSLRWVRLLPGEPLEARYARAEVKRFEVSAVNRLHGQVLVQAFKGLV